jgi:hypothetical protein
MDAREGRAEFGDRVVRAAKTWVRSSELIRSERALFALQGCFPTFDFESTLLKVVALQALDSSRAFSVARWAEHLTRVLEHADPRSVGPELVDVLAAVPQTSVSERKRALTTASRFAHYFVDVDRFPVLDKWTEAELARLAPASGHGSRYLDFADRHAQVAVSLGITRARHLSCYLWLAGQLRAWQRNRRTPIHRAARHLFESNLHQLDLLETQVHARAA